jgi:hypothetical protein
MCLMLIQSVPQIIFRMFNIRLQYPSSRFTICARSGRPDDSDLEEVYNTDRHLLYVACTRERDHLLVTSLEPAPAFLGDLRM